MSCKTGDKMKADFDADSESGNPGGSESDSVSGLSKIFKDPIHGTIRVSGLCMKIIDTPQFQRLRSLMQLGGVYFVYPGATHNRFEHSIGTYYLAGKFARILREKQPELFEEDDITCIEIAGLCHDLGHGPFSHAFDNRFIPRVKPDRKWKHEDASVKMLDYLLEDNEDVKKAFDKFDKDGSRLELIKDIILGGKQTKNEKDELVQQKRCFLYEIVANTKTGIDVDKWDYFARDCHMLGIKNNFDHDRYMMRARIIYVDGEGLRICARDQEANNLYDMFHIRLMLHRRACQHRVTIGVELMIVDALQAVDNIVWISGRDGKSQRISECIDDMVAYSKLNDSILQVVEIPFTLGTSHQDTVPEDLKRARGILKRLRSRDLYKCVGKCILSPEEDELDIAQTKKKITEEVKERFKEEDFETRDIEKTRKEITEEVKENSNEKYFEIVVMSFDYGKKKKDPVSNVWFYRKENMDKAIDLPKKKISHMLPENFQERTVAIYAKEKTFGKAIASSFKRRFTEAEIPGNYDDEPAASQG